MIELLEACIFPEIWCLDSSCDRIHLDLMGDAFKTQLLSESSSCREDISSLID